MPYFLIFNPGDENFLNNIKVIRAERITWRTNEKDIRLLIGSEYKWVSYIRVMPSGDFIEYDGWRCPLADLREVALPIRALQKPVEVKVNASE